MSNQPSPTDFPNNNPTWSKPVPADDGGPIFPSDEAPATSGGRFAIAGFVLGIISVLLLFLPNLPFLMTITSILGIIFSWIGRKSPRSGLANAGLLLSSITLLVLIVGAICIIASTINKGH
jgi:hypothetical protein